MMNNIIGSSYFPKELPDPFNTHLFANFVSTAAPPIYDIQVDANGRAKKTQYISKPSIHNLARAGTLRRRLSIPNPIALYQVAKEVSTSWADLAAATGLSTLSLTTPSYSPVTSRAISPVNAFAALPGARARSRAGKRYSMITDLNAFYPSIYTHSIPWALHSKTTSKARRTDLSLLGNRLDLVVRNGQDQQTVGIPISPDTSLVIAEVILSAIDQRLQIRPWANGYRYIDDYEFSFSTIAEAESALAEMQEFVGEYELQLNPRKSRIEELPIPLEAFWVPHLRLYPFRKSARTQAFDLLGFFGRAFELVASNRQEPILKYALSRTSAELIDSSNWQLYENLLLQCLTVEAGTAPQILSEFYRYRAHRPISVDGISDALQNIIKLHAPLGHGSEVAWAIWGMVSFNLAIEDSTADVLSRMNDSVVALISLDARSRGLISSTVDISHWATLMTAAELTSENWLLAYEANIKGWLPPYGSGVDYVSTDPYFGPLKANGVSFYDTSATISHAPLVQTFTSQYDFATEFLFSGGVSG